MKNFGFFGELYGKNKKITRAAFTDEEVLNCFFTLFVIGTFFVGIY